ncbi:hypothetical protein C7271_20430, partial [filamentous cyanobacterium CCP5]
MAESLSPSMVLDLVPPPTAVPPSPANESSSSRWAAAQTATTVAVATSETSPQPSFSDRRQPDRLQSSQPTPELTGLLRLGSQGTTVRWLQTQLRSRGFSLEVDGQFGPNTQTALIQFQSQADLSPDGIVGPDTWYQLQSSQHQSQLPRPFPRPDFPPSPLPVFSLHPLSSPAATDASPQLIWLALISLLAI